MRAVWSFWSKPYLERQGRTWRSPLHHLLAWGLSLRLAQRHHPETMLVTDAYGKQLLIDQLGLTFTRVSTELDCLRDAHTDWWALGKLFAYRIQHEPFLHLDTDVFLWKPLPAALLAAPVFAQCPEEHSVLTASPHPEDVEAAFAHENLSLPAEWEWSRSRSLYTFREANCGIVGSTRPDFLRYYAERAIDLALNPSHARAWNRFQSRGDFNMLLEQFFLDACVEFHRSNPESPFRGIYMRYLFPSLAQAFDEQAAARAGFTHLLGDAKRNIVVSERLEERTRLEDRAFYGRCLKLAEDSSLTAAIGA
jgi:hypothetical protein